MANPLPNHIEPIDNAIIEDSGIKIKTKVDKIKSSMDEVYHMMVKMGVIPKKEIIIKENEEKCCFFSIRQVLITLLESVKILRICCK